MTRFDDNLWREVERRYGAELSEADGPLSPGPRRRLPMIAGATLGVAGASAAAVVVLGAANSPPAFAVTTHRDGSISVVIRRLDGISGANRRLAQLGIHVRAVRVDAQCQAAVAPALRHVTVARLKRSRQAGWIGSVEGGVKASIRPQQIARNHTLVIAAVPSKGQVRLVRGQAVRGAIPGCLPPVAWVWGIAASGRRQTVFCSPAPPRHPVVVNPATDTTATNETTSTAPSSGSATTTGPVAAPAPNAKTVVTPTISQTLTTAGTATTATTGSGTATTGSGTTTNWQSTTAPGSPVAPPPILQACLAAARHAAQIQEVPRGAARSRR
jgi:hypothetical protein